MEPHRASWRSSGNRAASRSEPKGTRRLHWSAHFTGVPGAIVSTKVPFVTQTPDSLFSGCCRGGACRSLRRRLTHVGPNGKPWASTGYPGLRVCFMWATRDLADLLRANENSRPLRYRSFEAQSHTPCNRCVRFATTVASGHATLPTKRTLLLTWAGLTRLDRPACGWRTHSMTSSARASIEGGITRSSALAVLRLMTNSYLVGC